MYYTMEAIVPSVNKTIDTPVLYWVMDGIIVKRKQCVISTNDCY